MTYKQLNTILIRFGGRLEAAGPNVMDVYFPVEEVYGIFERTRKAVRRVGQIGFHDRGAEVGVTVMSHVRKLTGLTPENGCDSQVFFADVDRFEALISVYNRPLQRLANK